MLVSAFTPESLPAAPDLLSEAAGGVARRA
jgi:hypothetical protein